MSKTTCDGCKHFSRDDHYKDIGSCALMGDANDLIGHYKKRIKGAQPDRAYGWDRESYSAGVYVGPKFGCIHWNGPADAAPSNGQKEPT